MSIPAHATKVFSGQDIDIFQWQQPLFDGSIATFEVAQRCDSARAIVVTSHGTILVTQEEQPIRGKFTAIPWGFMERDDISPEEAIQREILEETGCTVESLEIFLVEKVGCRLECSEMYFIARGAIKTQEQSLDSGEKLEVVEVSIDEFMEMVMDEKTTERGLARKFLAEYRKDPSLSALKKLILGA